MQAGLMTTDLRWRRAKAEEGERESALPADVFGHFKTEYPQCTDPVLGPALPDDHWGFPTETPYIYRGADTVR